MAFAGAATLAIRAAEPRDFPAIWEIFHAVVADGDTYAFAPETTMDEARRIWMEPPAMPHVAELESHIVGTYVLRANQLGLGNHVANCGYMTHPQARRRGIGAAMCAHSLRVARERGFKAMQFNYVVASNEGAVHLWQQYGFAVVGRVPAAFRHSRLGLVDVLIMHRLL
jgi:ribosomal protein S18 acetylase RimI-like enzyme